MQKLVDALIENNEIMLKIKEISNFEDNLNNYINNNPELELTVFEYRKNINDFILKKIQELKIPQELEKLLMDRFQQKLDLIFAPSIGEYQLEKWYDYRYASNVIISHLDIERNKKLITLIFLKSINKSLVNRNIKQNEKILMKKPLSTDEIINLNKRVIYAMFGGIENIENIELAKYKFNANYTSYNCKDGDAIEHSYLKINVKDQNKISEIQYLKNEWDDQLQCYYNYLKNGLLTYQLDSIEVSSSQYEKFKVEFFKAEGLKNNHLLATNYSNERENFIKEVVASWKAIVELNLLNQTTNYLIDNIWEKWINPLIKNSKKIILRLVHMCYMFYNLKKGLRFQITSIIDKLFEENEIDDLIYDQLFDILYSQAINRNR